MWTVCWTDEDGTDRWDRLDKKAVIDLVSKLERDGNEDYLIFLPDSEVAFEDVKK